jgi:small subunit ribosomal protein S4
MKIGPKFKIAKRLGATIFDKTQSQKFALAQERSARSKKRGRGPTEYGKQLLEKQKIRFTYGITERQFENYVKKAMSAKGTTPNEALHQLLELRLDNVVYRLGLAPSRRAARQMVSHGHITVNGGKTTIPSRHMYLTDRIAIREGSKNAVLFTDFAEKFMERTLPSWLSWNPKSMEGGIAELPTTTASDPAGDLIAVLSFYSR